MLTRDARDCRVLFTDAVSDGNRRDTMTKYALDLDAELALRTIRAECGVDANGFGGDRAQLAFRSGQLCVTMILARRGRISLDALELAAVDRIVTPAELMREILRPLIARGFCRVSRGVVTATSALAQHRNAVEALMSGEHLGASKPLRDVAADKLHVGDYVFGVGVVSSTPRRDGYGFSVSIRDEVGHMTTTLFGSVQVAR